VNLAIDYHAAYRYEEPVGFSPHVVRLFPRRDHFVPVVNREFSAGGADVQLRSDLFDNPVAVLFFPDPTNVLEVGLRLELEIAERNPFHFLLAPHAVEMPFQYPPHQARALTAYMERAAGVFAWPPALAPSADKVPTVEKLVEMNAWIHSAIAYERRETGAPMSPGETLAARCGSCRDMAVLFAAALRAWGVAARLVSGYLWEPATEQRVAENALHAWVEAYLPGAGWTGFDPANGVLADHHRIAAAVGIRHEDIAPVEGTYFAGRQISSSLETRLDIRPL